MDHLSNTATRGLFGGDQAWNSNDWTASDDRVRGGKSQSYIEGKDNGKTARFHGNLDIETLGGAGFASQRTTDDDKVWDLSKYDGIRLDTTKSDGKRYTLILKDTLLSRDPDTGREQATTSWEHDFSPSRTADTIYVPWKSFNPTYRGREQEDAEPLRTSNVRRVSIMMRSFFGTQQGPFELELGAIAAYRKSDGEREGEKRVDGAETLSYLRSPKLLVVVACALYLVYALYRHEVR